LTDDQRAFQEEVRAFAAERVARAASEIDERNAFPLEIVREAAARGLLGITIPQKWGGGGRDHVSYALAIEALAKASSVLAVIVSVHVCPRLQPHVPRTPAVSSPAGHLYTACCPAPRSRYERATV